MKTKTLVLTAIISFGMVFQGCEKEDETTPITINKNINSKTNKSPSSTNPDVLLLNKTLKIPNWNIYTDIQYIENNSHLTNIKLIEYSLNTYEYSGSNNVSGGVATVIDSITNDTSYLLTDDENQIVMGIMEVQQGSSLHNFSDASLYSPDGELLLTVSAIALEENTYETTYINPQYYNKGMWEDFQAWAGQTVGCVEEFFNTPEGRFIAISATFSGGAAGAGGVAAGAFIGCGIGAAIY